MGSCDAPTNTQQLICSMVVIDVEITIALHGQRPSAVLCESGVHLALLTTRKQGLKGSKYMIQETYARSNVDFLEISGARCTIEVQGYPDFCLAGLAVELGGSSLGGHGNFEERIDAGAYIETDSCLSLARRRHVYP